MIPESDLRQQLNVTFLIWMDMQEYFLVGRKYLLKRPGVMSHNSNNISFKWFRVRGEKSIPSIIHATFLKVQECSKIKSKVTMIVMITFFDTKISLYNTLGEHTISYGRILETRMERETRFLPLPHQEKKSTNNHKSFKAKYFLCTSF